MSDFEFPVWVAAAGRVESLWRDAQRSADMASRIVAGSQSNPPRITA